MLGTAMLLLVLGQYPSPEAETIAAATDLSRLAEQDRPFARYLSMYAIQEKDRPNAVRVAKFWLNSLSRRKRMSFPEESEVSPTLLRVDIRLYEWDTVAWETLTQEEPYFRFKNRLSLQGLPPPGVARMQKLAQAEQYLRYYTQSSGAVLRLDYFVAQTCTEPHYSKFLRLPGTLQELEKQFYLQKEEAKSVYLLTGGSVMKSRVALNNRKITRIPSILGYWYATQDTKTNNPSQGQNVLHDLFDIKQDAGEFIWSLPNDLQAYYLANAQGVQQGVAPPDIAVDSVTRYRDKQVTNARSCVVCHSRGLNEVGDVISRIVQQSINKNQDLATISALTQEQRLELEEFYMGGLPQQMKLDQARYERAVLGTNGLDPDLNATIFQQIVYDYDEIYIDRKRAARELGLPEDQFRLYGQNVLNNILAAQLGGEGIPRDAWEEIYPSVADTLAILQGGGTP